MAVMADTKAVKKGAKASRVWSEEERSAMKDRARELKANASRAEDEQAVLEKISEMVPADRAMARRLHDLVKASAPALAPKLWYGMPAYAIDGKIVCFFQSGQKFKTRYATFGFSDSAKLDEGGMWPNAYALQKLTPAEESKIAALVKKAVS
jgi:uncharacterized protein YdhG (YjbR/CyaY superfamily)